MTGRASAAVFAAGLVFGTLAPAPTPPAPQQAPDGEQVLQADFHVHAYLGDGALPPWLLLQEARRNGLHVLAVTNHNQVFAARLVRWFAEQAGAPIVLVGQEVTAGGFHMIAAGIRTSVDWRSGAQAAVDAIHAQGGRAIAAHPEARYWAGLEGALGSLDGAEVWHPLVYTWPRGRAELIAFLARPRSAGRQPAAIGSSDFHVMTAIGLCRTYVFVREPGEAGVLEALGAGRTVVVDDRGQVHGDERRGRFLLDNGAPGRTTQTLRRTPLERAAAVSACLGLLGLVAFRRDGDPGEDVA